jgi:hypothetical protein
LLARSSTGRWRRKTRGVFAIAAVYGLFAYLVLPELWTQYERHQVLAELPLVTRTSQGVAGDPINIGLATTREDLVGAMHAAGWHPADAITLRSSIGIVRSVLLDRPYVDAPVSNLYFMGRREDLAFEKTAGTSADRRHHVRFWNVYPGGGEARAVWLGSASFDRGVGISHYTGAVTHDIAPNVDVQRDGLVHDIVGARRAAAIYTIAGFASREGRNGEGDPYFTDGKIIVLRLAPLGSSQTAAPEEITISPAPGLEEVFRELLATLGLGK